MNQHFVKTKALLLLKQYKLDDWSFHFDRSKVRVGLCDFGVKKIYLSRYFVLSNEWTDIQETLLHEIAHALDFQKRGKSDHSKEWKQLAKSIGCSGSTHYTATVVMPEPQFVYNCDCNLLRFRHNKILKRTFCKKCNNKISPFK